MLPWRRIAVLAATGVAAVGAFAGCSSTPETTDGPPSSVPTTVATPTTAVDDTTRATSTADAPVDGLFPDIVDAEIRARNEGQFDIVVTVSSPYDTPERYADAWRVTGADGTVFGIRELGHDHQNEQPFTRALNSVEIPAEVREVTIEGRDQRNGWGGATVTIDVPAFTPSGDGQANAASSEDVPFTIAVREFGDGEPIPAALTCDGTNAAPLVFLTAVPSGTQTYAFIVDDPDAPGSDPFVHWVVWGMPASTREISGDQPGAVAGTNDFGRLGWTAPCPPAGDGLHTYRFRLLALSEDSSALPSGLDARALLAEIGDSIIEEATVTGTYER